MITIKEIEAVIKIAEMPVDREIGQIQMAIRQLAVQTAILKCLATMLRPPMMVVPADLSPDDMRSGNITWIKPGAEIWKACGCPLCQLRRNAEEPADAKPQG